MAIELYMPQLGLTMTEGTVVKWLKKSGDMVKKGDALFEVETDKVVQEVTSLDEGTLLKLLVEEGQAAPVGSVIGYLGKSGEVVGDGGATAPGSAGVSPAPAEPVAATIVAVPAPVDSAWVKASPAAKNLAKKLGVDLQTIQGSGPGGRVVEADVRQAAEAVAAKPAVSASPGAAVPAAFSPSPLPPVSPSPSTGERIELRGIRKVVAERMAMSFATAPHFYLTVEVDASALVVFRQQIMAGIERRHGVRITVTDLLIKAAATALSESPDANSAWIDGGIQRNPQVNLGVAAAVRDGLMVPVIQGAERLSLGEIVKRRKELADKAKAGQLALAELEGGTFTLTNLGMFGIDQFQPIVNPPQAAILAVGRIKDRIVPVEGRPEVRPTMYLTLAVDHRILDGAVAAQFLGRIVSLLENPAEMLLG